MSGSSLSPQQRIMRAAKLGVGLRLSADDVWRLSRDEALATLASNDDEARTERETEKQENQK